ncbi:MAG TPA: phosphosulfolactate synthase [Micromonosporaceae bacterium]
MTAVPHQAAQTTAPEVAEPAPTAPVLGTEPAPRSPVLGTEPAPRSPLVGAEPAPTAFAELFGFAPARRPRRLGRNMCLDDGLSIDQTRGVFEVAGAYIDSIRIGRGGAALFPRDWVRAKAELCRLYDVDLQTGGPLYETAVAADSVPEFLAEAADLGFTSVEFSENIISVDPGTTLRHLELATSEGLAVYFEFGRKYPSGRPMDPHRAAPVLRELLDAGVAAITVERAEVDLVIDAAPDVLRTLADLVGLENLIFEAGPRTPDYVEKLFRIFDPQTVNLGNVSLSPAGALDGIRLVVNARHGLDRSVGYQFIRDLWKGPNNYGSDSEDA